MSFFCSLLTIPYSSKLNFGWCTQMLLQSLLYVITPQYGVRWIQIILSIILTEEMNKKERRKCITKQKIKCVCQLTDHQWWRSRDLNLWASSRSRGSKVSVSLETTLLRPQDLKRKINKIEAWNKYSVGSRFQYLQWKNDVFCVAKYLTRKILGLGLGLGLGRGGLGLEWSGLGLGLSLGFCDWDSITADHTQFTKIISMKVHLCW